MRPNTARNPVVAFLIVATLGMTAQSLSAGDLFVAPSGSDTNPGTRAQPLATIEGARDAIRQMKARASFKEPITVHVHGGVYRVEKTVEFTPQDSGTAQAPITYAACPGERPVISGGRPIRAWKKGPGAIWQAAVGNVGDQRWNFHQLFVGGQRRTRARTPNQGYLYTEGILAPFDRSKWFAANVLAKEGFHYRDGDIKQWKGLPEALIVVYHSWTTSIHFITARDPVERTVRLTPPSAWPIGYWWEYNTRYHVENLLEALDEPGEWYLDRDKGVVHYWPMPHEDLTTAEVIAPVVRQTLVSFRGDPVGKRLVEYLHFRGISFQHTDCYIARDMPQDMQGATKQFPLIAATGLRHSVLEDCEIAHAGENGLWLDSGCMDNVVRRCHIHDLGASAVFIGPKKHENKPEMAVLRNVVDNNFIHDGSHIFRGSQGVWIGKASYNQLTHNEISDFHHLGVSVGHSWGYQPSTAHHNLIAFNHVHHICNGYFSDGGGIYTLGVSPGTVLSNNIVHDVVPTPLMPSGGCGIYHDEGSTGIVAENNIVYNVGLAYHQHYGKENIARNNILAFARVASLSCARKEDHLSYTFANNIVLSATGRPMSEHYDPAKCKTEFHQNLYWDVSGKEPAFPGGSLAQWQATGRDLDSRVADPQFEDARNHDFRLKATSPALAMGFHPLDVARVGLYGDKDWMTAPSQIKRASLPALPPPPPPPPPRPLVEDFESTPIGKLPAGFSCSPADRPDLIQVTDEAAAGGTKSLKLTDAAGLKYHWQPHLYFTTRPHTTGKVRFACDLLNRAKSPSECILAIRDFSLGQGKYLEGPSLTLKADGSLLSCGKPLTTLPLGKWVHLEIVIDMGQADMTIAASKGYRLVLDVAGQPKQVYEGLPYLNPAFGKLTWFGFSSSGSPGAVFYVDNIQLGLVTAKPSDNP